jgi:pantoate--beta-alanine ligase
MRRKGDRIALVPTMGALHDGHFSLVRAARKKARRVVVSIFVNPAQFAPTEDFSSYPRTFKSDLAALTALGVDLVWAPTAAAMYPEGFSTRIAPAGPALAGLEDRFRPHFFGGVATVVAKLFTQVRPDFAIFGEKDYQQLKVVAQMAHDLDLGVKVVPIATIREKDGLAMSSRNAYLSAENRKAAPALHRVLKDSAKRINAGDPIEAALDDGRKAIARAGFALDYLEARHADTLAPVTSRKDGPIRILVAAKIGQTRLIDNIGV